MEKVTVTFIKYAPKTKKSRVSFSLLPANALLPPFPVALGNIYRLHRAGVQGGVVHHGGHGSGGGVEVLRLFWDEACFFQVAGEFFGFFYAGAGV